MKLLFEPIIATMRVFAVAFAVASILPALAAVFAITQLSMASLGIDYKPFTFSSNGQSVNETLAFTMLTIFSVALLFSAVCLLKLSSSSAFRDWLKSRENVSTQKSET